LSQSSNLDIKYICIQIMEPNLVMSMCRKSRNLKVHKNHMQSCQPSRFFAGAYRFSAMSPDLPHQYLFLQRFVSRRNSINDVRLVFFNRI
jgi:hypothetical protein